MKEHILRKFLGYILLPLKCGQASLKEFSERNVQKQNVDLCQHNSQSISAETAKSRTPLEKPESLLLFKNILILYRAKCSDLKVF
jgi:hypothetical protein